MSGECHVCKFVVPTVRTKHLSKAAYRIHLLGICAKVMRSFLFNVCVFFVGVAAGMGFTILHMQKMMKENGYRFRSVEAVHECEHDDCSTSFGLKYELNDFKISQ